MSLCLRLPFPKVQQPGKSRHHVVLHVDNVLSGHREQKPRITAQNIGDSSGGCGGWGEGWGGTSRVPGQKAAGQVVGGGKCLLDTGGSMGLLEENQMQMQQTNQSTDKPTNEQTNQTNKPKNEQTNHQTHKQRTNKSTTKHTS